MEHLVRGFGTQAPQEIQVILDVLEYVDPQSQVEVFIRREKVIVEKLDGSGLLRTTNAERIRRDVKAL
jgi:hypothetical protein